MGQLGDRTLRVLFGHLLDVTHDVVVVLDELGRIVLANGAATELLGWAGDELLGVDWRSLVDRDSVPALEARMAEAQLFAEVDAIDVRVRSKCGAGVELSTVAYTPIADEAFAGSLLVLRDLRSLSVATRRLDAIVADLERSQSHDPATGLPRIGALLALIESQLQPRMIGANEYVVAIGVTDELRLVERIGSEVVDSLVRALVAAAIRLLQPRDVIGRGQFGELIVILRDRDDLRAAVEFADRVRVAVADGLMVEGMRIVPELGIGVAGATPPGNVMPAVQHASIAARWSGERGGAPVEVFSAERHLRDEHAHAVRRRVREAMRRNQLDVHFQPIVETTTGRVLGLEGLLRWDRNVHDMPSLAAIFEAVEGDAVQIELDRFILELGCRRAAAIAAELGPHCPRVSLNVCPASLAEEEFLGFVETTLERVGLDPHVLCLEITEHYQLHVDAALNDRIGRLRKLGVALAVDDFGDGYSSLSLLHRIDTDVLKIDRSLIADMVGEPRVGEIVASAIAIGRALGAQVVAEGVETPEQRAWLAKAGCPAIQGYLVGRCVPWREAVGVVRESNSVTPPVAAPVPSPVSRADRSA